MSEPQHSQDLSAASITSVPLRCNICTKKPVFSDLSHLLTHIASKSHLSAYYKVKVRSVDDDRAHQLIHEYDTWYAQWNIQTLMSERMNIKEAKKRQKARQSMKKVSKPRKHKARRSHLMLDPLLDSHDPFAQEEHPTNNRHTVNLEYEYQPWLPSYQHPYNAMLFRSNLDVFAEQDDDDVLMPESPSVQAVNRRLQRASQFAASESAAASETPVMETNTEDGNPEFSKLKGVLWPGMDMFDSATPNMRRKRNQKKPTDVLDRLEAASKDIEATEVIYSADSVQQKARVITGFPNSSSPIKGEPSPIPVRKAVRRKALSTTSTNPRLEAAVEQKIGLGSTRKSVGLSSPTKPIQKVSRRAKKFIKVEPEPEPEHTTPQPTTISATEPLLQDTNGQDHDDGSMRYLTSSFAHYQEPFYGVDSVMEPQIRTTDWP